MRGGEVDGFVEKAQGEEGRLGWMVGFVEQQGWLVSGCFR